jgi:hypothetical protein
MLSIRLTILLLFTMTLLPAIGDPVDTLKKAGPDLYVKAQFAGDLGLISIGIGEEFFNKKLSVDLNYGYTPKNLNGVRVHTFAIKHAFHLKEHDLSGVNAGFYFGNVINYNITSNTYAKLPDYYPEGYYVPNAIHLNPFIGARINLPIKSKRSNILSIYSELGSVDYKVWYALKSKKIKLYEIWNICFGMVFYIN